VRRAANIYQNMT